MIKIVLVIDDESWAWVENEDGTQWECWYEEGDRPASRADFLDRPRFEDVREVIGNLVNAAMAA